MKQIIFSLFSFLIIVSCNNSPKEESLKQITPQPKQDTSVNEFDYEFDSFQTVGDTLKVTSFNHYFYQCFGKFKNPKELTNYFSQNFDVKKETGEDILYRVKSGKSFIKFFFNEEDKIMDFVSGKITSPDFVMTNGIKVGLTKSEVEDILFKNKKVELEEVKTVQIITALLGVWIDLNFEDEKLIEIKIDTDYQVNKE